MIGANRVNEPSLEVEQRGLNLTMIVLLALGLALAVFLLLLWKRRRGSPADLSEVVQPAVGAEAPEVHQASYFNIRTMRLAGSGLLVALALVLGVAVLLWVYFAVMVTPEEAVFPPFRQAVPVATPRPRVAELAGALQDVQATEQARLEGYGWVDQEAGIARIPISRAMQLLAGQATPQTDRPP